MKEKDKELFKESKEFGNTRLVVGVYSYDNGEAKLQLAREFRNADGQWQYSKLGRLSKEEIESLLPLIEKAKEAM